MDETQQGPKVDARAGLEKGKQQARELAGTAKERARQEVEARKHGAAQQVDKIAGAVERAREELGDDSPIAGYVGQFAGSMNQFAERLRSRNADELMQDFQQLARGNPGLFLVGSIGIGFALSRFLKAASPPSNSTSVGDAPAAGGIEPLPGGDPRPLHESASAYEPPLGTTAQPLHGDLDLPLGGPGTSGGASAPGTIGATGPLGGTTSGGTGVT